MFEVFRKFQGCFKEVLRVFTESFKGVSSKFKECFKDISRLVQGSFQIKTLLYSTAIVTYQIKTRSSEGSGQSYNYYS